MIAVLVFLECVLNHGCGGFIRFFSGDFEGEQGPTRRVGPASQRKRAWADATEESIVIRFEVVADELDLIDEILL
ncbi:MAG: hypothetical protein K8U57_08855 [Planctomycetes bacterium]|nr:hypothetical protein [Planctomycetota bacterium]